MIASDDRHNTYSIMRHKSLGQKHLLLKEGSERKKSIFVTPVIKQEEFIEEELIEEQETDDFQEEQEMIDKFNCYFNDIDDKVKGILSDGTIFELEEKSKKITNELKNRIENIESDVSMFSDVVSLIESKNDLTVKSLQQTVKMIENLQESDVKNIQEQFKNIVNVNEFNQLLSIVNSTVEKLDNYFDESSSEFNQVKDQIQKFKNEVKMSEDLDKVIKNLFVTGSLSVMGSLDTNNLSINGKLIIDEDYNIFDIKNLNAEQIITDQLKVSSIDFFNEDVNVRVNTNPSIYYNNQNELILISDNHKIFSDSLTVLSIDGVKIIDASENHFIISSPLLTHEIKSASDQDLLFSSKNWFAENCTFENGVTFIKNVNGDPPQISFSSGDGEFCSIIFDNGAMTFVSDSEVSTSIHNVNDYHHLNQILTSRGYLKNYSDEYKNLIVESTGEIFNPDNTVNCTNYCFPIIQLSKKDSKAVVGVIQSIENGTRDIKHGNLISNYPQDDDLNRVIYITKGITTVWVTDENGSIENGDKLTSSVIKGYATKSTESFFCKALQNCDFVPREISVLKCENNELSPAFVSGNEIKDFDFEMKFIDEHGNKITLNEYRKALKDGYKKYFRCVKIAILL